MCMNICEECFKDAITYFNLKPSAKHSKYIALRAKHSNPSVNNAFMTCPKAFTANQDTQLDL